MPYIGISNHDFYYEYRGRGRCIVCLHGLEGNHTHFDWLSDFLIKQGFSILSYDQRGSGLSDKHQVSTEYSTVQLADDTAELMSALGIETAAVIGLSMGGMVAQHLAIRYPSQVERLILGCTSPGGRLASPPNLPHPNLVPKLVSQPLQERALRAAKSEFSPHYRMSHPHLVSRLIAEYSKHPPDTEALKGRLYALWNHDASNHLSAINCSTLVITGTKDAVIPSENSQILSKAIPRRQLKTLPNVGHRFWDERPDESCTLIKEFLGVW